jgi:hypothetical protein
MIWCQIIVIEYSHFEYGIVCTKTQIGDDNYTNDLKDFRNQFLFIVENRIKQKCVTSIKT